MFEAKAIEVKTIEVKTVEIAQSKIITEIIFELFWSFE